MFFSLLAGCISQWWQNGKRLHLASLYSRAYSYSKRRPLVLGPMAKCVKQNVTISHVQPKSSMKPSLIQRQQNKYLMVVGKVANQEIWARVWVLKHNQAPQCHPVPGHVARFRYWSTGSSDGVDGREPDPLSWDCDSIDSLPHPSQHLPRYCSGPHISPYQWHRP